MWSAALHLFIEIINWIAKSDLQLLPDRSSTTAAINLQILKCKIAKWRRYTSDNLNPSLTGMFTPSIVLPTLDVFAWRCIWWWELRHPPPSCDQCAWGHSWNMNEFSFPSQEWETFRRQLGSGLFHWLPSNSKAFPHRRICAATAQQHCGIHGRKRRGVNV